MAVVPSLKASETQSGAVEAWVALLRGHAAAVRALNARLLREHGLTVNGYEALLLLAKAPEHRLRRTDLARSLVLTASGVTRMLDGLEAAGLVEKARCPTDARVTYAVLTDAGREKLGEASCSHVAAIEELFGARFSEAELDELASLLGRLTGPAPAEECAPR